VITETRVANHKSALKRARQSVVRKKRNTHIKSTMRTQVKNFRAAVAAGDAADAAEKLKSAESAIRKAASKGVIPQRRASRSVSRLSKQLLTLG
jgi:small subunit ribosomal protein S20